MKVFFDPDCLLHSPPHEVLDGKESPYLEAPLRLELIRDALAEEPERFRISSDLDETIDVRKWILKVHDPNYLEYLETAYNNWVADGGDETGVFPETFPHISLLPEKPMEPKKLSVIARAGLYSFDLSSPITEDTFKSVLAAVKVVLSSVKTLVNLASSEGVFSLCRPPGHHAMPSLSGGYCYLNNIAIAARFLQSLHAEGTKVAILDIDYHHGNGTQHIFYDDPTVLYVSLHAEGDYPYFTGFASETGAGEGEGYNINIPLPQGTTGDKEYCDTLSKAVVIIKNFDARYLLVSLGIDTHEGDPICNFKVSTEGYKQIGQIISTVKKPTLFVLEGGYYYDDLGASVRNVLKGFQL